MILNSHGKERKTLGLTMYVKTSDLKKRINILNISGLSVLGTEPVIRTMI